MSKMQVLKNIFSSISTNTQILSMLSLLGVAFFGVYSVFAMHYYVDSLYKQRLPKNHCQSIIDCILQLYIRQEIGADLDGFKVGRFTYDLIYSIFMQILFSNIISGVLIDSFASLRNEHKEIEEDKTGRCFICAISKEDLQKKNQNLKDHYTYQYHKLWNYVFYLYHLEKQRKKTGLELIISLKYKMEDVSWIPSASSEAGDVAAKINELQMMLQTHLEELEDIDIDIN